MANKKHLAKLKESVEAWNQWRIDHPEITNPDLIRADLVWGNLIGANLRGVDLVGAHLSGADLIKADLLGANLGGADLSDADLSRASLVRADLSGADLSGANLDGADFSQAQLYETIFIDTDLTAVQGLEHIHHDGPSALDYRTLQQSGPLPLAFLRGCGLPDTLIDHFTLLWNQPIQYHSCFISYSHKNEEFAKRLHTDLQNHGVRCWYAPEDMKIGDPIRPRIHKSIHNYDKLLLILTEHSVASQWVEQEVETAFEEEKKRGKTVLFPIRLDDAIYDSQTGWAADIRRTRHIGDFSDWKDHDQYQSAFERLMRDLKLEPRDDTESFS